MSEQRYPCMATPSCGMDHSRKQYIFDFDDNSPPRHTLHGNDHVNAYLVLLAKLRDREALADAIDKDRECLTTLDLCAIIDIVLAYLGVTQEAER